MGSKTYLFKVVDLPDDGLPTKPMRGSRGITNLTVAASGNTGEDFQRAVQLKDEKVKRGIAEVEV